MSTIAPQWLENIVIEGIQRMLILRLQSAPANDTINPLVDVWLEIFTDGRHWDEGRDTPRLHEAFRTVLREEVAWPSPAQVLKAMPPIPPQPRLEEPAPVINPEHIRRCQDRIKAAQKNVFKRMERKP